MAVRIPEKCGGIPLMLVLLFFLTGISFAQENRQIFLQRYQNGTLLFQSSHWFEAAVEFRRAQENAVDIEDWSRALYWVVLSELAYADYGSAIKDMNELERNAPNSVFARDMAYHRGRVYFNQGFFEDALGLFRRYIDSVFEDGSSETEDRRAAAFFWIGECLYTMGEFDEALKFYSWVVERFPNSPKVEVSSYRIDLIKQKKIEAELLALLQWSHEESLRSGEDIQRQIRIYEYTISQYQRRIAELSSGLNQEFLSQFTDNDPLSDNWQSIYDRLLERAKRLNKELEQMIDEYVNGSGGSL
jgi:tetratricopeptide (TPR) repeat protein